MKQRLTLIFILSCISCAGKFDVTEVDRSISGKSAYPIAIHPSKVGHYPAEVKSGAGYFYDDVLEYRVWLHPEQGAERRNGDDDYFAAFAQYEKALNFSKRSKGAEEPLVLIRQLKYVNEPTPGVFQVVEEERLTEWQVQWLSDSKRLPRTIEKFMAEHHK